MWQLGAREESPAEPGRSRSDLGEEGEPEPGAGSSRSGETRSRTEGKGAACAKNICTIKAEAQVFTAPLEPQIPVIQI